jgi:hypothetical protein
MNKSASPKIDKDDPILEFPVDPDFIGQMPPIDLQAMLARIAESMPYRKSHPGEQARRIAEKIEVEFVL